MAPRRSRRLASQEPEIPDGLQDRAETPCPPSQTTEGSNATLDQHPEPMRERHPIPTPERQTDAHPLVANVELQAPPTPPPPPPAATPISVWRRALGTIGSFFNTPSKRPPPEQVETPPTKRQRTDVTPAVIPLPSADMKALAAPPSLVGLNKLSLQHSGGKNANAHTPRPLHLTSAKSMSKRPTSLAAIAENTRSSLLPVGDNPTPEVPFVTPSKTPSKRRTIKEVRAMHESGGRASLQPGTYAWERARARAETPRPKAAEPNADARLEKYARMQALRKELAKLEEDADVKAITSHKRKRVKVDHLVEIPHKRPEDSEGTFRVPEWDSDDEMEVDESVEERTNVFVQAQRQEEPPGAIPPAQSKLQSIEPTLQPAVQVSAEKPTLQQAAPPPARPLVTPPALQSHPAKSRWQFPSLGKRKPEHAITATEKERCRVKFAAGLQIYLGERGLA